MNTMFDGDYVHKATSIHIQIDVQTMLRNLPDSATIYVLNKNELEAVGATNNLRGLSANIKFIESIVERKQESVKKKYSDRDQTETEQFKRWFGDWQKHPNSSSKVVNADGTPMVVYHQTDGEFTVFDVTHNGAGSSDNQTPFGIFLKSSDKDIGVRGKKQMALYANIRNPLRASNRADLVMKLKQISPEYANLVRSYDRMTAEFQKRQEAASKALEAYMLQWRKDNSTVVKYQYGVDSIHK